LLDNSSGEAEHLLKWNRDPEAYSFSILAADANVMLEIYEYPTDAREPELGELVFVYSGINVNFAGHSLRRSNNCMPTAKLTNSSSTGGSLSLFESLSKFKIELDRQL
jgi:hypothetical protein